MTTAVYITKPGDVLDKITHEYYQGAAGAFEKVLAANPGISSHGSILPGGINVVLPALPEPEDSNIYTLW